MLMLILFAQSISASVDREPSSTAFPSPYDQVEQRIRIGIDANGNIYWNLTQVDRQTLRRLLAEALAAPDPPEIEFAPDERAPYAAIDAVLSEVKAASVKSPGFVGRENYENSAPVMTRPDLPRS